MRILMLCKYPPIQGGVCADAYWTAQLLAEMGHEVHVVTNADEVEPEYRMEMNAEDEKLLTGFNIPNSVHLHRSYIDEKHVYIPQGNPSVSKLVGIALKVCYDVKPDFIWASYVEPFGVAALLLSALAGIPYTIRHAGSDIGRLMLTDQLKPLYHRVFTEAAAILTSRMHHERFMHIGVDQRKILDGITVRAPAELFCPKPMPTGIFTAGCYGKTGRAKGTPELLEAMALLQKKGIPCELETHWGGRFMPSFEAKAKALDLKNVTLDGYVPHWRIPQFIHNCHVVLFLENNFSISFHTPGVPMEALACGRPVITTEEIESKNPRLVRDENCIVIPSSPLTARAIADALERAAVKIATGWPTVTWPAGSTSDSRRAAMTNLLDRIRGAIDYGVRLEHSPT